MVALGEYCQLYDQSQEPLLGGTDHARILLGARRRQFFELADIAANARRGKNAAAISPIALEAVKRIDALFDIERGINGQSAEERLRVRKEQSEAAAPAMASALNVTKVTVGPNASVGELRKQALLVQAEQRWGHCLHK